MNTISVIIVTHNSATTIGACLTSLACAGRTAHGEVIIVDTASTDATLVEARAGSEELNVTVLSVQNRGFGAAANAGAARAVGDILWFLNPDTVVPLGSGERLLRLLHMPRVVAASNFLTDASGNIAETFGEPFPSFLWYIRRRFRLRETQNSQLKTPYSVPWLSAASLLVQTDAFRAVGGFSQQYFLYYEDVDLGRRLRMAGGVLLIDPAVRIRHAGGQSTTTAERLRASDVAEDRYFAEYRPPWERALLRMFRPFLRVRWGVLLSAALACGLLFSVSTLSAPVAVLAGMLVLWCAVVRVPDLGAHLLLASLLIGQILRLPLGTTTTLTVTDLLLPLVVGAWLVRAARGSRQGSQRVMLWSMLLPLLALLPGLLLATERLPVRDWVTAATYAARLLLLLLLVPLGARVLQRPWRIPLTLVGVTAVMALLGVMQWSVLASTTEFQSAIAAWLPLGAVSVQGWDPHVGRLFSTWLDPNLFGGMLVLGVAALLTLPLPKRIVARLAALGGGSLIIAALVLTKSRTALLALGIVLAASVVVARPWRRLFVLTAGLALVLILTPSAVSRLTTVTGLDPTSLLRSFPLRSHRSYAGQVAGQDPTAALRVRSWQQAIEQTQRAPVFGLGYNAYGLEQRAVGNIQATQLHSWAGADSSPLTFLATTGVWGTALLLTLLLGTLWALLRRGRSVSSRSAATAWTARAAFLSLFGIFVHAQFVHSLVYIHLAAPLALLLGASLAGSRSSEVPP